MDLKHRENRSRPGPFSDVEGLGISILGLAEFGGRFAVTDARTTWLDQVEKVTAAQISFIFGAVCVLTPMWFALEASLRHRSAAELEVRRLRDEVANLRGVARIRDGRPDPLSGQIAPGNWTPDRPQ